MCRHRIFPFNFWGKDVPGIQGQGTHLQETTLAMSLAYGQQTNFITQVMIEIEGRSVLTRFIILPKANGNRTLLGTDFLSYAGLILDVKNACWYFWDNPTHKYPFGEELDTPSIAEKMSSITCQLKEEKGECFTSFQKEKLTSSWNPSKMSSNRGEKQQLS
ncbi:retrovirus-related Pol polyprotein from transposon opus [Nephila pilipes]|uniref:Retrovirus-related Pol polyprotein from transposon opus n=1 Tax=Nephila pilipes TaxID=299642 RepID=A0A8X6TBK9_NEPPI|nr:retrovirus-related Pol polyprotein from transposon opus [Nephila pilipes]